MEIVRLVAALFLLSYSFILCGQDAKLAMPMSFSKKMLSPGSMEVLNIDFRLEGSTIRFTDDGSEPTIQSEILEANKTINKPCALKYRVFHPDFLSSDVGTIRYFNEPKLNYSVSCSPAHPTYNEVGSSTLTDGVFGSNDFHQSYLGFEGDTASVHIKFKKKTKVNCVYISTTIQQGSWIFGPSEIVVRINGGKDLITPVVDCSIKQDGTSYTVYTIYLPEKRAKAKFMDVEVLPLSKMPDWHAGAGKPAWVFIDEVWLD